jgi:hypothetical protein
MDKAFPDDLRAGALARHVASLPCSACISQIDSYSDTIIETNHAIGACRLDRSLKCFPAQGE